MSLPCASRWALGFEFLKDSALDEPLGPELVADGFAWLVDGGAAGPFPNDVKGCEFFVEAKGLRSVLVGWPKLPVDVAGLPKADAG